MTEIDNAAISAETSLRAKFLRIKKHRWRGSNDRFEYEGRVNIRKK